MGSMVFCSEYLQTCPNESVFATFTNESRMWRFNSPLICKLPNYERFVSFLHDSLKCFHGPLGGGVQPIAQTHHRRVIVVVALV